MNNPRMGIRDRLGAKSAAWQHEQQEAAATMQQPSGVSSRTAMWEQKSTQHKQTQQKNPFTGGFSSEHYVQLHKGNDAYGRPEEGSKTDFRGKAAGVHVSNEIVELCEIIATLGTQQPDGTFAITFGYLFETYTRISNKLVGMLMRARKQKLIKFEGEMLFQRRDDDVIIWLMKSPDDLMAEIEEQKSQLREHAAYADMKK